MHYFETVTCSSGPFLSTSSTPRILILSGLRCQRNIIKNVVLICNCKFSGCNLTRLNSLMNHSQQIQNGIDGLEKFSRDIKYETSQ